MPPDLATETLQLPQAPHSIEAEHGVLGGLLIDNLAYDRAADLLTDGAFYRYEHRLIFGAIRSLIQTGKPADVVTVFEYLQSQGKADAVGGLKYLNQLAQSVPSAANLSRYAEIVRERSFLRKLIEVADEIASAARHHQGKDPNLILDEAESKVLKIREEGAQPERNPSVSELALKLIEKVQAAAENPNACHGLHTGFEELDTMTSGLQAGDLVVLAARPSMGKTALALNIAEHVVFQGDKPVLVFSMEMSAEQLILRIASSLSRVPAPHLRSAHLDNDGWGRFTEAMERLSSAKLQIDESSGITADQLRAKARRMARKAGGRVGLVVVDYIQLMSGTGSKTENRTNELP